MINKLSFSTPVCYQLPNPKFSERLLQKVDDYLFVGLKGKKAFVIQRKLEGKSQEVELRAVKQAIIIIALKIASWFLCPFLPLACLGTKAILRNAHHFHVTSSGPNPEDSHKAYSKEEAEKKIKQLWTEYKKEYSKQENQCNSETLFQSISLELKNVPQTVFPDRNPANVVLPFENDPEVFFYPNIGYLKNIGDGHKIKINFNRNGNSYSMVPTLFQDEPQFEEIKDIIQMGFSAGKSIVLLRILHPYHNHATLLAFRKDGKYRFIDSSKEDDQPVDLEKLTEKLNQVGIKDGQGKGITFKGKKVLANLQKDTPDCMRFATLYALAIGMSRKLGGWKSVNASFEAGLLNRFEDVRSINFNIRKKDASDIANQKYISFMQSWFFRSQGTSYNTIDEIPVSEIKNQKMGFGILEASSKGQSKWNLSKLHLGASVLINDEPIIRALFVKTAGGAEMSVDQFNRGVSLDNPLMTLSQIPLNADEKNVLYWNPGRRKPMSVALKTGETLWTRIKDLDGSQREVFIA